MRRGFQKMNIKEFSHLLQQPQHISDEQTKAMAKLIEKHPYFQPARALYLRGLKNSESLHYNQQLKVTAAYTTDRSVLFDYITSEQFIQNEISKLIKQNSEEIKQISVTDVDDISINKSMEIHEALKDQINASDEVLDPNLFEVKPSFNEQTLTEKVTTETTTIEATTPEAFLHIGKPLEFDKSESHSFSEWLKITRLKPVERTTEQSDKIKENAIENETELTKKFELIDKFLINNPKIVPTKEPAPTPISSRSPIPQHDGLMTETLARIYLEQKNYDKAIQSYKILSLKYPEKSGFFADQIKAVKQLQVKNNT